MSLKDYLPFWNKLQPRQQSELMHAAIYRSAPKGTVLHNGEEDCVGPVSYTHLLRRLPAVFFLCGGNRQRRAFQRSFLGSTR